jgi:hypothetical protein
LRLARKIDEELHTVRFNVVILTHET